VGSVGDDALGFGVSEHEGLWVGAAHEADSDGGSDGAVRAVAANDVPRRDLPVAAVVVTQHGGRHIVAGNADC
jgi:hypothetical protein